VSLATLAQKTDKEEQNKDVIRRYQERTNSGDAKGAAAYISEDMVNFGRVVGREGVQHVLEDIFATFPDWHMETLEMVAVGDVVIVRQKVTGTHLGIGKRAVNGGLLVGVPPTGKRFEATHMHWYTLRDGKIVEHYGNRDDLGMMQQLGLVPMSLAPPKDSASLIHIK
jgi:predicted ester cyclase